MMNKQMYVVPSVTVEALSLNDVIATSGGETGNTAPSLNGNQGNGDLTHSNWGDGW